VPRIVLRLLAQDVGELFDVITLALEHGGDVDSTDVGDDQFEQQLAAQIAQMLNRSVEPLAKVCPTGSGRGEDRPVAAGDAWLLADRVHVAAGGKLLECAVGERSRQRPHPADVSRRLQPSCDREAVGRACVQDSERRALAQEELFVTRSAHCDRA
jgi:hypothetical protein